jgi:hypothetical protein
MSDKNQIDETSPVVEEEAPVQRKKTKYDEKMEKRAAEKKKAARDEVVFNVIGSLIIVALVALIASFPIRSYMAVNQTVCTVDGEEVSKVMFDYYYNNFKNTYMNNYGSYLSYYGIDSTTDLSTVSYDDYLTFQDYFEEQTIEQIKQTIALRKQWEGAGFSYDSDPDYENFVQTAADAAAANGMTVKEYYRQYFGDYASAERLENIVRDLGYANAYLEQLSETTFAPTDDEIDAYYSENADSYDLVDYRLTTVSAELPTAPTELADEGATVGEDGSYTPSDAEKEAAMSIAKLEADATDAAAGELHTGESGSSVNYYIRSWLFDASRAEGDTTVIENTSSSCYYVVEFVSRYVDTTPTVDLRAIISTENNGEEILAAYEAGGATEESFIEQVKEYSSDTYSKEGLYEGQTVSGLGEEMESWLTAAERKAGDVTSIWDEESETTYVLYYKGQNKASWYFNIKSTLQSQNLSAYLEEITTGMEVYDPKGNLKFIALRETQALDEAAAAEESTETTESSETTESTEAQAE